MSDTAGKNKEMARTGNIEEKIPKAKVDKLVKSRLTGANRCPVTFQLSENTGFRLSPE